MKPAADARLHAWRAATRRRRIAVVGTFALPWLVTALALAWRLQRAWSIALVVLVAAVGATAAWRTARRIDARWLARRLDARRADMEDSAALLFADGVLSPLQALQRERLRQRVERAPAVDLRDRWPARTLATSFSCALLALLVVLLWPAPRPAAQRPPTPTGHGATRSQPALTAARLDIVAPAYTGLAKRTQASLDASAPEGATLRWTLRFSPQPASAVLHFLDGRTLPLRRAGDDWIASLQLVRPALYRIGADPALPASQAVLHRIDVRADAPPTVRILQPARSLSVHAPGQRSWPLLLEAEDDYGLAPGARLRLVRTQGSGENITTRERSIALAGSGTGRHRRWSHALDLGALGLSPGDDVIAQFEVADNRAPRPHVVRSASVILRWPPESTSETSGMDGLVRTTLPAYLRSQRQVIIDAEALLKQKHALDAAHFLKRSNALGDDQQALRLRYGRFLGEESEGAPQLPTSDLPTSDAPADASHAHSAGEGAPLPAPPPKFGEAGDILGDYGHVHDTAEAATLLDPDTRETLRAALRNMWDSELHLRQGDPAAALPFAYKALGFIKQVQQASRIYLARTAIEVPPIDESRRLTGKRDGLGDRADVLAVAPAADPVPANAWRALQDDAARPSLEFDALARWVRAHADDGAALDVLAALDDVRQAPDCRECRARLRAALWPLLPRPPAGVGTRGGADAAGRAYLEALDGTRAP